MSAGKVLFWSIFASALAIGFGFGFIFGAVVTCS
jgi:hypothetical protein